jgi:hypothetical protein
LKEKELPEIEVELSNKLEKGSVKKGDIVTVSGSVDKYVHGLFGTTPKWMIEDGAIIKTSDKAKKELLSYQDALLNKKNQIAEKEKKKEIAKIEEEKQEAIKQKEQEIIEKELEKKEQEQEAIEVAKLEGYGKSPEGILENAVTNAIGKKIVDTKRLADIRNEGNNWTIELNTVISMTKNMTRNGILSYSQEVFQEVYSNSDNYKSILLVWLGEVVDVKGHVSIQLVMKIEIKNTNAKSINWENFDYSNFSVVADTFWDSGVFE